MNKRTILISFGVSIVIVLFLFGKTAFKKEDSISSNIKNSNFFSIDSDIIQAKKQLTYSQNAYISKIENDINITNSIPIQIENYNKLAGFWKDSIKNFEFYIYYISKSSKLENSEKSLTFAAQLILDNLRIEQDEAKINWKTELTIDLFERAIKLNPNKDELKIGLGSAYIFGKGRFGSPDETMKGVQELLGVVRKDSTNMKAQLVLGIGGVVSGQYDKAIYRLQKVVMAEPNNLEAVAFLADSYAAQGNKKEAIRYYEMSKKLYHNHQYSKEVDERIKQLTQND